MTYLSWEEILANAMKFSHSWNDAKKEEAQAQPFMLDFIKVFGIHEPLSAGEFEFRVNLDDGHNGYIDYFWPKKIAIEMKSPGKDLKKAYEQLKNYIVHLKTEEMPDLLMVSDFTKIQLYHRTSGKRSAFKVKDLRKHIREFALLAGYETSRIPEVQLEVNVQAAEKMAKLHDALLEFGYAGHNLETYLVRLLFCLFAEDTDIFPKNAFLDYVANSREDGSDLAGRLEKLFEVLNMPPEERTRRKGLTPVLLQFQYINGKLFEELLPQADFDEKMRAALIECSRFDWSKISPAIFGSIFQGVMDRKMRRELGAHYTSEENILKLINSLFMDDLWSEFERIKTSPARLNEFHKKIANLKFLDPACGCGNFLIITYRELRRLELAILKMLMGTSRKQLMLDTFLKVGVHQFYGIEIEEFPAQIAQVGMWLMDHQMNMEASEAFGGYYARLPLKQGATIKNRNALATGWLEILPGDELDFIMGNPPFAGARVMKKEQKEELFKIFQDVRNAGDLDYVSCWFVKANDIMIEFPHIRTAFVATNSITQGIQPGLLWKPINDSGSFINFAYRTFKWQSEARGKAAVHCVIIGFDRHNNAKKYLFEDGQKTDAKRINGYLMDAENIYVESHQKSLWNMPEIGIGNQPVDNGNFLFTEEEKNEFLKLEPLAEKYFHIWLGAEEFLNNRKKFCLCLGDCPPDEIANLPQCLKVVANVRKFRQKSKRLSTQKLADTPAQFLVCNMPVTDYLIIPKTSSETRKYIPIGFEKPETLCGDALFIMPNATLFHFGILTSSVHNAWVRAIAGRLEMRYRYSKDIIYNNFPWPLADKRQTAKIETLARGILAVRATYGNSSMAELYNPLTMPRDLLTAHQKLDSAVLRLYGLSVNMQEKDIVDHLLQLYQEKIENKGL